MKFILLTAFAISAAALAIDPKIESDEKVKGLLRYACEQIVTNKLLRTSPTARLRSKATEVAPTRRFI